MRAMKTKYYFRKKSKAFDTRHECNLNECDSTDSEEFSSKDQDARRVTLHVIADPGQSGTINASFQKLIGRLGLNFDVIYVSERFKPIKHKTLKNYPNSSTIPAVAVVLFFNDKCEEDTFEVTEELKNNSREEKRVLTDAHQCRDNIAQVRRIFAKKPWHFHHKAAVDGKLIICDNNLQDYFEYSYHDIVSKHKNTNHFAATFPLWGVRKVHYGRNILRFTIFVSQHSWENQIDFYKLILRTNEMKIRDDFCYFVTYTSVNITVQLGLKRLSSNLKLHSLSSTVLQFKVKKAEELIPLLPYSCEVISELRWRTRDHDSNPVLIQTTRTQDVVATPKYSEKLSADLNNLNRCADAMRQSPASVLKINTTTTYQRSKKPNVTNSLRSSLVRDSGLETSEPGEGSEGPSMPRNMPTFKLNINLQPPFRASCSSTSSGVSSDQVSSPTSSEFKPIVTSPRSFIRELLNEKHPKCIKCERLSVASASLEDTEFHNEINSDAMRESKDEIYV